MRQNSTISIERWPVSILKTWLCARSSTSASCCCDSPADWRIFARARGANSYSLLNTILNIELQLLLRVFKDPSERTTRLRTSPPADIAPATRVHTDWVGFRGVGNQPSQL